MNIISNELRKLADQISKDLDIAFTRKFIDDYELRIRRLL